MLFKKRKILPTVIRKYKSENKQETIYLGR